MKSIGIWCATCPLLLLGLGLLWAGIQACGGLSSGAFPLPPGEAWLGLKLVLLSCMTLFSSLCMACLGLSVEIRPF